MWLKKEATQQICSREMRALEVNAEYFGITLLQLMENAGRNVADEVVARAPQGQKVAVFCGLGGNGGDGFVAARHLAAMGYKPTVFLAGKTKDVKHTAAQQNLCALQSLGSIPICEVADSTMLPAVEADVVIDALLGTGTKGTLKQPIVQLVKCINGMKAFKLAVDAPTGIDADTGDILGVAVKADVTVTFHKAKAGLANAKKNVGKLLVKSIGLPSEIEGYAGPGDVLLVSKPRLPRAHKGDFGRLLVIGGSETFSGAPALVSLAAFRTGIDLAYVAAPAKTAATIAAMSPDLITLKLDGDHLNPENVAALKPYMKKVDAVVLGPGVGLNAETSDFVKACVAAVEDTGNALLLDADGLKAFADFQKPLKVPLVLTPHAGEYKVLTGKEAPEDLDERIAVVQRVAAKLHATILLKGQVDVISDGQRVKLNFTGNAGMTVGGTGDVLSGVVGAFLAQNADPFEAAVAGAFVNGAAGDFVADDVGCHMMASDIINWIPNVIADPMSHSKVRRASAGVA